MARISLQRRRARVPESDEEWRPVPGIVALRVIDGGSSTLERLRGTLEGELGLDPEARGELESSLRSIGREYGRDPSAPRIRLAPEMSPAEATRVVLRSQLDVMRAHLEGVKHALDPEFLHEFRVAVRRTRSILSQCKKLFPRERVDSFRLELGWLGKITGPARDADVLAIKLDEYGGDLIPDRRDDLPPLAEYVRRRGEELASTLCSELASRAWRTSWRPGRSS